MGRRRRNKSKTSEVGRKSNYGVGAVLENSRGETYVYLGKFLRTVDSVEDTRKGFLYAYLPVRDGKISGKHEITKSSIETYLKKGSLNKPMVGKYLSSLMTCGPGDRVVNQFKLDCVELIAKAYGLIRVDENNCIIASDGAGLSFQQWEELHKLA